MPHVDARYYARVAWGHVYVGTTKNPSPKGERLRLLVVKPLGLIPVYRLALGFKGASDFDIEDVIRLGNNVGSNHVI